MSVACGRVARKSSKPHSAFAPAAHPRRNGWSLEAMGSPHVLNVKSFSCAMLSAFRYVRKVSCHEQFFVLYNLSIKCEVQTVVWRKAVRFRSTGSMQLRPSCNMFSARYLWIKLYTA